jgi:hypothetical protein
MQQALDEDQHPQESSSPTGSGQLHKRGAYVTGSIAS